MDESKCNYCRHQSTGVTPTMDELFDNLTRIIAHPHTAITDHDRVRAAKAIIEVSDFYLGYLTDDAPDLYLYSIQLLDELEGK